MIADIVISNGRVSSKVVAEKFGKNHFHVLRDIKNLQKNLPVEFSSSNFGCNKIKALHSQEETIESVDMTRDGFVLLAMGFTGKEALVWKVRFIEAFNAMEYALQNTIQKPRLLQKPKTARITHSVVMMDGIMGEPIYKRHMTRVEDEILTPVERLDCKRLNLILQAEGCLRKAKKLEAEIDYLRQPPALRLVAKEESITSA